MNLVENTRIRRVLVARPITFDISEAAHLDQRAHKALLINLHGLCQCAVNVKHDKVHGEAAQRDTRSATASVSARRCKLKVVATQSKETERGAVSCIAWLGRFGTRGERYDVSLFQMTLQAFELLVIPDFRRVCDAAPIIGTNFEEERMSNFCRR